MHYGTAVITGWRIVNWYEIMLACIHIIANGFAVSKFQYTFSSFKNQQKYVLKNYETDILNQQLNKIL